MKRLFLWALVFTLVIGATVSAQTVINYGNLTFPSGFTATNFSEVWDLTQGDLVLTYTIDMTGVTQPAPWQTSYTEVGIREVGAGNFNPGPWMTYQGGKGGWMTSLVGNLAPSPGTQSIHDKHNLGASGGRDEHDYDATNPNTIIAPSGSTANYGIWFDRDSVDPWQALMWGMIDGGTYNTGGIYHVVISYHAISPTLGTMFATINGIQTGFYTAGWFNGQPPFYPAGLSFKGDMTKMQVFAGLWAPSTAYGTVTASNIQVNGHLSLIYNFAFVANQNVEISRNKHSSSKGNLFSNGSIYFKRGDPTTFTGNLTAVGNITIDKENTIAGNVIAGGKLKRASGVVVTGIATDNASVAALSLPNPSFSAGGPSHVVPAGKSLTLPPGVYGNVYVKDGGTLNLSSGEYRFDKLETKDDETTLNLDVSGGGVTIKVVSSLRLSEETTVNIVPSGPAGSAMVTFITMQSAQVLIAKECYVLGTFIARNAEVFLGKNTSFKGAIIANKITVDRDVTFLHHLSSGTLPIPKPVIAEGAATEGVVTDYELAQNYPNPFNPSTTIRFALPQAGELTLAIYNSAGQLVRSLAQGEYASGRHQVVWNGRDESGNLVASGVYFYRLRAGDFVAQKKLVLMK